MKKYGKNAIITVHKSSFSRKRQGNLTTDKGTTEMFEIGNKVAYSPNGVCEIVEISKEKFGTEYREYYVLKPIFDERSKYFVPVDNEKCTAKMRRVASEKDAKKLFENLSAIKGDWIDNEEKRKNFFKEKIAENDLEEIATMVKIIHKKKIELLDAGRCLHKTDEMALKDAERLLYDELAYLLKLERNKTLEITLEKMNIK